jgi:hypothetical protein
MKGFHRAGRLHTQTLSLLIKHCSAITMIHLVYALIHGILVVQWLVQAIPVFIRPNL